MRNQTMKVGYARVSTHEQNLDLQIDALTKAGCEKIYTDKISGSKSSRPELDDMLKNLRSGDTIVVWKLDRLGRSIKHLIELSEQLQSRNIALESIQDKIDTSTASGRLYFNMMASLAEFERDLIRERTKAGLESAKARGRQGGRPTKMTDEKLARAKELHEEGRLSIKEICTMTGVSKATLYRHI